MAGREKGSGLQGAIVAFFARNPDEELHYEDISLKWGATRKQVTMALTHLRKRGEVRTMGQVVMRSRTSGGF